MSPLHASRAAVTSASFRVPEKAIVIYKIIAKELVFMLLFSFLLLFFKQEIHTEPTFHKHSSMLRF